MRPDEREPDPDFEQRWQQRFERYATEHDDDAGIAGWSATGLDARLRQFGRLWGGDRGRYLDAGCGAGTYTRYLLDRGIEVVGVDYSVPTAIKARERSQGRGLWAVADARRLPVRGGGFDGVICFGVSQALSESAALTRELARIVRPGGRVWIDGLNRWCLPHLFDILRRRLRRRGDHLRYESPWRLARQLRRSGVDGVRIHWLPIAPSGWSLLQKIFELSGVRLLFRMLPPVGAVLSHGFIVTGTKTHTERSR